jgi:alpha-aminoadipic semialdehyde synthase
MFFSHTIKAQDYNMPLLDKLLELRIRLIDYECIRDEKERLVAFGRYAGIAGTVDFLRGNKS